jgi:hypothetical protein
VPLRISETWDRSAAGPALGGSNRIVVGHAGDISATVEDAAFCVARSNANGSLDPLRRWGWPRVETDASIVSSPLIDGVVFVTRWRHKILRLYLVQRR